MAAKAIPFTSPTLAVTHKTNRSTRAHLSPVELLAVLKIARARSIRDWASDGQAAEAAAGAMMSLY